MINPLGTLSSHPMDPAPSTDAANSDDPIDPSDVAVSPLLIVGAPRSGTTWLQRLLLGHPACVGGQESHLLVLFDAMLTEARRKAEFDRPHGPLTMTTETAMLDSFRRMWLEILAPTLESRAEATLLVEKTPDHALHLELADRLLPRCRVIHLVRHPADVAASLVRASKTPWGRDWAPGSVDAATRRWVECVEAAESAAPRFGASRFMTMRYEDLRSEPARRLGEALEFAGLPTPGTDCARIIAAEDAGRGAAITLRGDLGDRSLVEPEGFGDGTRHPTLGRRDLRRCLAIAGPLAGRFGHDPKGGDR